MHLLHDPGEPALDHLKGDRIHSPQVSGIETANPPLAPALAALCAAAASELDRGGPIPALCERLSNVLAGALRDDGLVPVFEGHERSFIAYRDPQRGFVVHASVHAPGHRTPAHDHAEAWAVYGSYRGRTSHRLFDREAEDAGSGIARLTLVQECVAEPGEVMVVLPGQVHENGNPGDTVAWNVVLRPRPLGELWRRAFDPQTGRYRTMQRGG